MKPIICKTCQVESKTVECESNKGAILIESNWCRNCKYMSKGVPYHITCTFPPEPKKDKESINQPTLF